MISHSAFTIMRFQWRRVTSLPQWLGLWADPEAVLRSQLWGLLPGLQERGPSFAPPQTQRWHFLQLFAKAVYLAHELLGVCVPCSWELCFHSRCKEVFKFALHPEYLHCSLRYMTASDSRWAKWRNIWPVYEKAWDTSNTNLGFQVISQAQSDILWRLYS